MKVFHYDLYFSYISFYYYLYLYLIIYHYKFNKVFMEFKCLNNHETLMCLFRRYSLPGCGLCLGNNNVTFSTYITFKFFRVMYSIVLRENDRMSFVFGNPAV